MPGSPGNLDGAGGEADPRDPTAWITSFAAALGVEPPDPATVDTLLELAGVAAHASQRTAAPIAAYLVGRAGLAADAALEVARQV
jgi:hypothetical protein